MKIFKNVVLFLLTILVFALATLLLVQRQQFSLYKQQARVNVATDSIHKLQLYSYILNYGQLVSFPLQGDFDLTDSIGKAISLKQLITQKTYIYHFDETNCFTCVEKYLPHLLKLAARIGKRHVVLLGSFEKPQELFASMKAYDTGGLALYNIDPKTWEGLKIKELNAPFIFETNKQLNVKRFYIPEKTLPALSELYDRNTPSIN